MKIIGISSSTTENRTFANSSYHASLKRAGCVSVGLPVFSIIDREVGTIADYQAAHKDHIDGLVERLDSLILSGGIDINPTTFDDPIWGAMGCNNERDMMELALIDAFVKANKPILGVCRGAQILGHYLNLGNFSQDLGEVGEVHQAADRDIKDRAEPIHRVFVLGAYRDYLRHKTGRANLTTVNVDSHHHQAYLLDPSGKVPKHVKGTEARAQWLWGAIDDYEHAHDIKIIACTGMVIEGYEKAEIKAVCHQHHPEEYSGSLAIQYWLDQYLLN